MEFPAVSAAKYWPPLLKLAAVQAFTLSSW